MANSIIVSFIGPNNTILIEMMAYNERYFVRTYETIDHAIARYEKFYENTHGEQESSHMGKDFKLDPRIHEVEGDDVSALVRDDIVDMDQFLIFPCGTPYGILVGALAVGPMAEAWHGEGIQPGNVMI